MEVKLVQHMSSISLYWPKMFLNSFQLFCNFANVGVFVAITIEQNCTNFIFAQKGQFAKLGQNQPFMIILLILKIIY